MPDRTQRTAVAMPREALRGRSDWPATADESQISRQEEALFREWRLRVEAGLGEDLEEQGDRFALVQEIHEDVARRYPLGIAGSLRNVLDALVAGDDGDAHLLLLTLENDERNSRELNREGA